MIVRLSPFDLSFEDLELGAATQISKEAFRSLQQDNKAKRICFSSCHANALKEWNAGQKYPYKLVLPFRETIGPILNKETGIELTESMYGGMWRGLSEAEYNIVKQWITSQGDRVFLRDLLDLSIAIAPYIKTQDELTEFGKLEQAAKYDQDLEAAKAIVEVARKTAKQIPFYSSADGISYVPPRPGKDFDLPEFVAKRIAKGLEKPLISAGMWTGEKAQLKDVTLDKKWDSLEKAGFAPNPEVRGKRIILMDDLYQSGCTLHFIAEKMKSVGAKRIFGLALVKSGRNTDNS